MVAIVLSRVRVRIDLSIDNTNDEVNVACPLLFPPTIASQGILDGRRMNLIEDRKRDIIKELARRLESDGMPTEKIAIEIANQLEGYASAQYVRKCLDGKYKLQSKVRQSQQQEEEK